MRVAGGVSNLREKMLLVRVVVVLIVVVLVVMLVSLGRDTNVLVVQVNGCVSELIQYRHSNASDALSTRHTLAHEHKHVIVAVGVLVGHCIVLGTIRQMEVLVLHAFNMDNKLLTNVNIIIK